MYTVNTALDALKKYDISETDLINWEEALSLEIPVDEYGRKQYSPHHVNLFKNVKKHITLGRTLDEIKRIVSLPPLERSKEASISENKNNQPGSEIQDLPLPELPLSSNPAPNPVMDKSPYASVPPRPIEQTFPLQKNQPSNANKPVNNATSTSRPPSSHAGAANVVHLVERLSQEKDQLYKKLLETEKLNSHLYSANTLFHKKVREMTDQVRQLRQNFNEEEKIKLMDDKARLHKQLIDAEKLNQYKQEEILNQKLQTEGLRQQIQALDKRIQALSAPFNADKFCGDWMETGHLLEVSYDNFGVNIEKERVRLFRISEKPSRIYGTMAIIYTSYQYETNSLWKRNENLFVTYVDEQTLDGELSAEYILDGVPVAKALYRVTCRRSQ